MTDHLYMPTPVPRPRPEVYYAPPTYHGGLDYVELEALQLKPEEVLDFSVNSNPFGPSPCVQQALASIPLDRYPDREALALRRALAERLQVTPECIVVGNGAAELFWLIALAYVNIGDDVLILSPTFGEYARVAELQGARVHHWTARAEDNFAIAEEEVFHQLKQFRARLVFICNPNNPTGAVLSSGSLKRRCLAYPETLFVIDESYHAFARGFQPAVSLRCANLLVVRSMT
ncbi:MAG: aminotransferase class I/II-fold pyridoxal phosphate-dependent enzyme, partial [Anaerolineae bacterium]|nr:aminotransferase class I/II-fold pyridoxal phosphate-dependent enzyme [Anaerolineae bacterium]